MQKQEMFRNHSRLLTRDEAAHYLHISLGHLANITKRGLLARRKLGRCVRYAIDDLDAYVASCHTNRKAG